MQIETLQIEGVGPEGHPRVLVFMRPQVFLYTIEGGAVTVEFPHLGKSAHGCDFDDALSNLTLMMCEDISKVFCCPPHKLSDEDLHLRGRYLTFLNLLASTYHPSSL